ncbi:uncharacterized protein PRCAT00003483001 [Priceomyces carsonii]|uniref:uncharacterized protein n=1 Tax=Priceomyces carsonii TaxID=28549 RepID=UPI002EDA3588|nr:unnamed protein product [Priceomyces carsonii]
MVTIPKWTPSSIPASTTLTSVATSHSSALHRSLTSALKAAAKETALDNLASLSQVIRGAQASLTVIDAEGILATATDESVKSKATHEIFGATLNLKSLTNEENVFGGAVHPAANILFLVLFSVIWLYIVLMFIKSRYVWFNVTFFFGYGLEFTGFLGRVYAGLGNETDSGYYNMQIVCLTIAPAFIMAGIYFLFAQMAVVYGRQYSALKPMWYSYFFIVSDVVSLLAQAAGGALSSAEAENHENTDIGTYTMIGGIGFQVLSMSIFLLFWIHFFFRVNFKNNDKSSTGPLNKRSISSFTRLLLNLPCTREHKIKLDRKYNPQFKEIRQGRLFNYFPLAVTLAVIFIYIRSIYRVVELAQGFNGYLITHEAFLMVFDALMIVFVGLIFFPFHPYWAFSGKVIKAKDIRKKRDEGPSEKAQVFDADSANAKYDF